MAKLTKQKARKEYKCFKCNRKILKGEVYQKIIQIYRKPIFVCCDCVVPRSELTSSEYLSWLYDLQDNFQLESPEDVESLIENIEDQKYELEDRFSNIPDQLQEFVAGEILQERIDVLDDAIRSLEQIEFEESDDETDLDQECINERLEEALDILMSL